MFDKKTGNVGARHSLTKLHELACDTLGVDLVQGAVEELERLHKSNQNREKQSSFLKLCQESDPRGTMIHWNGWSIDDDQQAHQSPPCHHPQHEHFKHVAVIDYATGTEYHHHPSRTKKTN